MQQVRLSPNIGQLVVVTAINNIKVGSNEMNGYVL